MKSFLITFKPATENPERGWPLKDFRRLLRSARVGKHPIENWRFNNRKEVAIGDRVFLLLQGKKGPAIIGYGHVAGAPNNSDGSRCVPVAFESLAEPTAECFASKGELLAIDGAQRVWRTQSSGILLDAKIATALETLVVNTSPKARSEESTSNPDWTRDELIVALDMYLRHRPNPPAKDSQEIQSLSNALKRLGEKLFPSADRSETFRNENGVYMKLMNFRRLDPQYTAAGKVGLTRGSKEEKEVWAEFANDATRCRHVAEAIMAALDSKEIDAIWFDPNSDDGIQEAAEGRLLTRTHIARERNRKLVETKLRQALKKHGKLFCEVCAFDFATHYGNRGKGFMECHHTKPVATLSEGHKTHIDDLALVCANCHRIIHRGKPWLSVADLRTQMNKARLKSDTAT